MSPRRAGPTPCFIKYVMLISHDFGQELRVRQVDRLGQSGIDIVNGPAQCANCLASRFRLRAVNGCQRPWPGGVTATALQNSRLSQRHCCDTANRL